MRCWQTVLFLVDELTTDISRESAKAFERVHPQSSEWRVLARTITIIDFVSRWTFALGDVKCLGSSAP